MILETLAKHAADAHMNIYGMAEIADGVTETCQVNPANPVNDIYSVSKNFTATAIGILVDRGLIRLSDTVYDFFHSEYPDVCHDGWKQVTVEHVLTQTIGIDHGIQDIDVDDIYTYPTDDYLRITLSAPLVYPAGTHFTYSDSNFYLASRIVSRVTGEKLQDFLRRELFIPLKFQGEAWATCPHGYAMGGTGLFIRAVDMAKFGQLYLNRGVFDGKRILSESWCDNATASHVTVDAGVPSYYGFSFWRQRDIAAYQCGGMYGQSIYISPERKLVVAWQCFDEKGDAGRLVSELLDGEKD